MGLTQSHYENEFTHNTRLNVENEDESTAHAVCFPLYVVGDENGNDAGLFHDLDAALALATSFQPNGTIYQITKPGRAVGVDTQTFTPEQHPPTWTSHAESLGSCRPLYVIVSKTRHGHYRIEYVYFSVGWAKRVMNGVRGYAALLKVDRLPLVN